MTDTAAGRIMIVEPREVPLGGLRAMTVRRTLPHRDLPFIGAWCFADHYGPDDVAQTGGMDVPPHPHTGLQTVSWLIEGEIEHRDTAGVHALVRPGELNLMTAGRGIAHSEVSTPRTRILHGVQLWVVLPAADAGMARGFQHHAPAWVTFSGGRFRVFIGDLAGERSPVVTQTPLLGAEVVLEPGAAWHVASHPAYEHGVLVDSGAVTMDEAPLAAGQLGYRPRGPGRLSLANAGDAPARVILLGGAPFEEDVVMWWNFIARSTEEIRALREEWQARSERFGEVEGYAGEVTWVPAPVMPPVTLRPRGRRRV